MALVLIYRQQTDRSRGLEPIGAETVADTVADKETAAWQQFTRRNPTLPAGSYEAHLQGKGFSRQQTMTVLSKALGPVPPPD